jgi:hypothetical protein
MPRNITVETLEGRLRDKDWFFELRTSARRTHFTRYWHFRDPCDGSRSHLHGPKGAPAVSDQNTESAVLIREEWRFGKLHRDGAPARILRDRHTGTVIREDWFFWGRHHRTDGPAIVKYDRVTGAVIYEGFWEKGRKLSERVYPENDTNPTPRMVAARKRRLRERSRKEIDPSP